MRSIWEARRLRAQPAPQKWLVTLSDVNVDLLHQSRRAQTIENSPRAARIREERTAFAISQIIPPSEDILCHEAQLSGSDEPAEESSRETL